MTALTVAIAGCTGRMGLTLVKAASAHPGIALIAGSERPGYDPEKAKTLLSTVGCPDLTITTNSDQLAGSAQAIIDFTTPEATVTQAQGVAKHGGIHIIGTTGFTHAQQQALERCATRARIVQSGNFSLGVNLMAMLVEQAARSLDETYDIEIHEMHHKHKKDAPSGTALMLGHAAALGRNVTLEQKKVTSRDGIMDERNQGDIGFSVARGGDVVGIHSVLFAGPGELIELKHQGFSRDIYANGALHAAFWAANQAPGLYAMQNILES